MTSLIVHLGPPDDPASTYALARDESSTMPDEEESVLTFTSDRLIHDGNCLVYRGILTGYPGKVAERKAICKIVQDSKKAMDRLRREGQVYDNNLFEIQACSVPRYFGIFSGETKHTSVVCILLQDCGIRLERPIQHYDVEFRIKVLQALMVVHEFGIQHNDFCERNILVDDAQNPQRVFVIDFDHATDHDCERNMELLLYTVVPSWEEFGCDELWRKAKEYGLWTPYYVRYMGESVSCELFRTPEELVKAGRTVHPECEVQDPLTCARRAIEEYRNAYMDRAEYVLHKTIRSIEPAWPPLEYGEEMS